MLNNVLIWRPAKARNEPCATGIMVRVTPIGVLAHGRLSNGPGMLVQRRICIRLIEFCEVVVSEGGLLKLCDFREVEVADFHGRNHHLESFFAGGAHGGPHHFDIAQHLQNGLIEAEIAHRRTHAAFFYQK